MYIIRQTSACLDMYNYFPLQMAVEYGTKASLTTTCISLGLRSNWRSSPGDPLACHTLKEGVERWDIHQCSIIDVQWHCREISCHNIPSLTVGYDALELLAFLIFRTIPRAIKRWVTSAPPAGRHHGVWSVTPPGENPANYTSPGHKEWQVQSVGRGVKWEKLWKIEKKNHT